MNEISLRFAMIIPAKNINIPFNSKAPVIPSLLIDPDSRMKILIEKR